MTHKNFSKFPPFAIAAIIILIMVASGLVKSIAGLIQKRNFITARKAILAQKINEKEQLEKRLREVQTPEFVEHEARERLGMSKEGETIVLMNQTNSPSVKQEPKTMNYEPKSNWQRWWKLFF